MSPRSNLAITDAFDPDMGEASAVSLAHERAEDRALVDVLIDRAFGPGRFAKAAERLREGNRLRLDLSLCAFGAERLVGAVRQWEIQVGGAPGVFLGPIAVEGAWRKHGVGGRLIEGAIAAAGGVGADFMLLVGDQPLFGPYGFKPVPSGRVRMPGPVDGQRVLWRPLKSSLIEIPAGVVTLPRASHG